MQLLDTLSETICYVDALPGLFRQTPDIPFASISRTVSTLIGEALQEAAQNDIKRSAINAALFPVCVWMDETILASTWENKAEWAAAPMQKIHFHTTKGGEEFFTKFEALPENEKPVMEVYLYCLIKGFRGKYFRPESEIEREGIIQKGFSRIFGSDAKVPSAPIFPLSLDSGPPAGRRRNIIRKIAAIGSPLLVLTPVGIFFLLYTLYNEALTQVLLSMVRQLK